MTSMSCRYQGFMAVSSSSLRRYSIKTSLAETQEAQAYISCSASPMDNKDYLVAGTEYDCRELLLDDIAVMVKRYRDDKHLQQPNAVYIRFSSGTSGNRWTKTQQAKIQKFADLVFQKGSEPVFNLYLEDGFGVLAYNVMQRAGYHHRDAAAASFLLYVIRNDEILDWCINYAEEKGGITQKQLFTVLAKEFLDHYSWGNVSNDNVSMSYFAYNYGAGSSVISAEYDSDGPKEYAESNYPISALQSYVRNIILPWMTKYSRKMTKSMTLSEVLPMHEGFRTQFAIAIRSLILSESL